MKKSCIVFFLFILCSMEVFAQSEQYITARSGLNLHSKADISGDYKFSKIPFREKVSILGYSNEAITVGEISAKLANIRYKDMQGWVFTGYLSKDIPTALEIKLYFKNYYSTNENDKINIDRYYEPYNTCIFSYDAQEYDSLEITGIDKNLSLEIYRLDKGVIFEKKNFNIKDKITFPKKDFDFEMGLEYKILLKQNEKNLIQIKVSSESTM